VHVVDRDLVLRDELVEVEAERAHVLDRSFSVSSKAMNTPGSSKSSAPRSRNSMPKSVLPQPALPQMSVGRPRGRPPRVISSSPEIPVGAFASAPRAVFAREGRDSDFPIGL